VRGVSGATRATKTTPQERARRAAVETGRTRASERFCGECMASLPLAARRRGRVNANAERGAAHPARGATIARANEPM